MTTPEDKGRLHIPVYHPLSGRGGRAARVADFVDRVRSLGDGAPRGWPFCFAITLLVAAIYTWRLTSGPFSTVAHLLLWVEFFAFYGLVGAVIGAGLLCVAIFLLCRLAAKIAPWFEL